jgi:hypothetical protein
MGHERFAELQSGLLRQNPEFVRRENYYWAIPYAWLVGQMEKRIGPRPEGVVVPVWGWYSFAAKNKRPDLRRGRFSGVDAWMVGVELEPERVLLHDYQLWHFVLNGWYLPKTEEEAKQINEAFDQKNWKYPGHPWEERVIERYDELLIEGEDEIRARYKSLVEVYGDSWEQIFDLGYNITDYADDEPELQATFWELRKEDVFEAVHINRRSRPNDVARYERYRKTNDAFDANHNLEDEETYRRWHEIIEWGVND